MPLRCWQCQPNIAGRGLLGPQLRCLGICRFLGAKKRSFALSRFDPMNSPLVPSPNLPLLDCNFRLHAFANVCQFYIANLPRTCGECKPNAQARANCFYFLTASLLQQPWRKRSHNSPNLLCFSLGLWSELTGDLCLSAGCDICKLWVLRALSSAVEHYLHTVGVAGSNPAARTIFPYGCRRFYRMKIRFAVDQAEAFRRGVDCPKSIVTVEVDPKTLSQEERDLIADRLEG